MKKIFSIIMGLCLIGLLASPVMAEPPTCKPWQDVMQLVAEKGTPYPEVKGVKSVQIDYPSEDGLVTHRLMAGKGGAGEGPARISMAKETNEGISAIGMFYFYDDGFVSKVDFMYHMLRPVSDEEACAWAEEWLIDWNKYSQPTTFRLVFPNAGTELGAEND